MYKYFGQKKSDLKPDVEEGFLASASSMVCRLLLNRLFENVANCRATICHSDNSLSDGMLITVNKSD